MTSIPELRSLADVRRLLRELPGPDAEARAKADRREPLLTKPAGALGRLEELSAWLAAWQGRHPPRLERCVVQVFAGNHGVTAKGVSAFPSAVTAEMVANFERGGAAINQICRAFGWRLDVTAVDLDRPTGDVTEGPAMGEDEWVAAFRLGAAAVGEGCDALALGEMGIGNTTAAAAVCHGLYGGEARDWTGPGTGVAGEALARKARAVAEAVRRNGGPAIEGLECGRRLGGRELAAIAGAVVAARLKRIPVVLDGYVCTAAAAPLAAVAPGALDHCRAGHVSAEPGHRRLLEKLGLTPLLDLGLRLGEGTGAALALNVLKAAAACHAGMATFAEAGVSGKDGRVRSE